MMFESRHWNLFQCVIVFFMMHLQLHAASGANIFISVTYGEGSHYVSSTAFAERLAERGHNVTYLIANSYEKRAHHPVHSKLFNYEIFNHSVPIDKVYKRTSEIAAHAFNTDFNLDMIFNLERWIYPLVKDCRATVSDSALMERLRNAEFDVSIIDITWGCSVLLNAYLGTPTILYNPLASQYLFAELMGAPALPAVVPEGIFGTPQQMNFWQRLSSFLLHPFMKHVSFAYFVGLTDPLRHEFGIMPDQTLVEFLSKNVELVITNSDPTIDLILPLPPAVIEVGGLLTKPANPLEEDLDDFMNTSGQDGVIVLSLGTYVKAMPQRLNDLFASVFARLPQKVVWQLPEDSPTKLSENVHPMGWLPQNDLLGHPKTKLFIYQGGNNGLYEALYHGVPILVLPVFADQIAIAARVTEKGMGLSLDIHSLRAETLENTIKRIISDDSFAERANYLSEIYRHRSSTTPSERAAFWIEHVIKFGGKHMEIPSKHLNALQMYLVDVVCFLLVVTVVLVLVMFYTCRCAIRCSMQTCRYVFYSKPKMD